MLDVDLLTTHADRGIPARRILTKQISGAWLWELSKHNDNNVEMVAPPPHASRDGRHRVCGAIAVLLPL